MFNGVLEYGLYSTIEPIIPDKIIYVGGVFSQYNYINENNIIRLFSDAKNDLLFDNTIGFGGPSGLVYSIIIQPDKKIICCGAFLSYKNSTSRRIIRINENGTIDFSFDTGYGFNNTVFAIAIQSDGKIIAVGGYSEYKGNTENYLIRINVDGSKDTSFDNSTGFNGTAYDVTLQSNNKILVSGSFTTYKGVTANRMIRLNSDGSIDTSFDVNNGFNSIANTMALQSDGKILVGGFFTSFDGVTANRIIRLNSDGTKDTSFDNSTGFSYYVYDIAIQSDGKILVGGDFDNYKGVTVNRIIRLNTNGSIDTGFVTNIGSGFDAAVYRITIQSDGKILVGGEFTSFDGVTANNIIRLNTDGGIDTSFDTKMGFNAGNSVWAITI